MDAKLRNKTTFGIFWSFSERISRYGINFVIQIILARLLLPEDFGIIGMITIFIAVSQSIMDSGFGNALIREKNNSQEDYSTVFFFNLIASIILYIVLFFSSNLIANFYSEPKISLILKVLGLVLIVNSFGLIQRTILIKKIDFKTQTKVVLTSSLISGIVAVLLAYFGFGVWSLVFRNLVMQFIQSLLFNFYSKWRPSFIFSWNSFKRLFNFGWKLLVSGLINTLYNNIYLLIIGKFFSTIDLGYYTNAKKFSEISSSSITTSIQKVTYPVLSEIKDDKQLLLKSFKKLIRSTVFINFFISFFLAASANSLIPFLFGSNWIPSIPYFQILCFSTILFPLHAINLNILQVKGRSDLFLKLEIIKKTIGVAFITLAIIFNWGIIGLLLTGVVSSILSFFINSYYSKKILQYSTLSQIKDILPSFIVAFIMGFVVYYTGESVKFSYFIELIIQLFFALFIYGVLSRMFKIKEINVILKFFDKRLKRGRYVRKTK